MVLDRIDGLDRPDGPERGTGTPSPKVVEEINCILSWADEATSSKVVAYVRLKNTFIGKVTM